MNIDLDINNYDLKDLLNLFQLDYNFTKDELRKAKKVVLKTHPDKSGLDKEYFLFFSKAYKLIFSIFEFRQKNQEGCVNVKNYTSNDLHDEETKNLLKDFMDREDFNKLFNQMFEGQNLHAPSNSTGYGEWLKSDEDIVTTIATRENMNQKIDERKKEMRALVSVDRINSMTEDTSYSDLLGDEPECYGSGVFSQLQYEDLRKAHRESVIPVTEEDMNQSFKSLDELTQFRNNQLEKPDSIENSNTKLDNEKNNQNVTEMERAFKLAKQEEDAQRINNTWMTKFKQLL